MKAILKTQPVYLLLLSLFFVFHGYTENYDFIPLRDASILCGLYLGSSAALMFILWVLYRNTAKAGFIAFLLMGIYFFFGYIYDILDNLAPNSFVSKYSVILVALASIVLFFFIFLFRYKGSLHRLNRGLNTIFICLLLIDAAWLTFKIWTNKSSTISKGAHGFSLCDTCSKPDIYMIVADDYAGDRELKETMDFDNHEFKDQLSSRGFYSPSSFCNYNFTPFSVSSMLDMKYLTKIEKKNTSHKDLSICYDIIRENSVFQFLNLHGYKLFNYSIFDIHDQPAMVTQSILPEKTKFITAQTLLNRIDKNILFNMANRHGGRQKKRRLMLSYDSNVRALDSVRNIVSKNLNSPKFVYAHLIMPHYPYYFDKSGKWRGLTEIREGEEQNLAHYTDYLLYTNGVLLSLIDNILLRSYKPPIIILTSDHGFREFPTTIDHKYYFMNLLSIYLPDQNYSGFYENMSNVNLFKILFNKQFNQRLPLLKDSTVYINP